MINEQPKTTSKKTQEPFTKETFEALEQLGLALHKVYIRLRKEGFDIVDGALVNLNHEHKQENTY